MAAVSPTTRVVGPIVPVRDYFDLKIPSTPLFDLFFLALRSGLFCDARGGKV